MTKYDEWGTSTLGLAAAVKSLGARYVRADKSNPRSIIFYFTNPEDTSGFSDVVHQPLMFQFDEVERQYINDELRVNAKKYYEALADLKTIIHIR